MRGGCRPFGSLAALLPLTLAAAVLSVPGLTRGRR